MSGFGASPKDSGGIPISSVYIPDIGLIALRGSANTNTDGSGNESTAALLALGASNSTSGTLQNAQTGSSNGTALPVLGYASVVFTVNMASFTGTVTFKASEDGTHYDPINVTQAGTGTISTNAVGSTTTSIHCYDASIAGYQSIEAVTSGVSAGNVTVTAHAIPINIAPRTVTLASGQSAVPISQPTSSTATPITSVPAAISDTSLLASNTSRKGAYFYNDGSATLYLSLGTAAASTTSYTVQIPPSGFFELPTGPVYTNAIRGIWSAASGAVRITELS